MTPLDRAINLKGQLSLARALGVTHQAIRKWASAGRLPRSEFSGETGYASTIESETGGAVTATDLLEWSRAGWKNEAA